MNKTASVLELLLLLVVVVITSAVVLFLVQSGMISVKAVSNEPILNTEFIPLGREGSINLQEIKLCESVDKDFHCFNEKNSFVPGDKVYLVFLFESSAYNGKIMISTTLNQKDNVRLITRNKRIFFVEAMEI